MSVWNGETGHAQVIAVRTQAVRIVVNLLDVKEEDPIIIAFQISGRPPTTGRKRPIHAFDFQGCVGIARRLVDRLKIKEFIYGTTLDNNLGVFVTENPLNIIQDCPVLTCKL